jgi:hypothetical protein
MSLATYKLAGVYRFWPICTSQLLDEYWMQCTACTVSWLFYVLSQFVIILSLDDGQQAEKCCDNKDLDISNCSVRHATIHNMYYDTTSKAMIQRIGSSMDTTVCRWKITMGCNFSYHGYLTPAIHQNSVMMHGLSATVLSTAGKYIFRCNYLQ